MPSAVKCVQCGTRFRPDSAIAEGETDESGAEAAVSCPRCNTPYEPPEAPPKNWGTYAIVGLGAGILIAGVMLISSWLNSGPNSESRSPQVSGSSSGNGDGEVASIEEDEEQPEPVLPGAVLEAPEWLDTAGPFNPHDLFVMPEPERNAAPLYLDALFGFSSELAVCFPVEYREPRLSEARARSQEFVALFRQWEANPQSTDKEHIDLCLAGYKRSFERLAVAQLRERCVFQSDLNLFSEQRHVNAARELANVAALRIVRTLQNENSGIRKVGEDAPSEDRLPTLVETCLSNVELVLRLSRDIRPAGRIETQLASLEIDQTMLSLIPSLVSKPELTVSDCDRMTTLLTRHRAESMNPFVEGMRAEYLLLRTLLSDLRNGRGLLPEFQSADPDVQAPALAGVSPGYLLATKAGELDVAARARAIDEKLLTISDDDFEAERDTMDGIWTDVFKAAGLSAALRRTAAVTAEEKLATETFLVSGLSRIVELADAATWWETTLNALHCVVAVRRWELEHTEPPQDLLTAVRQSGMPFVPVDPYGGGPMRLAFQQGEAVVYSVGPDGIDDAAARPVKSPDPDSKGDIVFRIPYHAAIGKAPTGRGPDSTPAGF